MKVKLFTHTDLDGVGCGIVAKYAFGDNVDIQYCDYDNVDDKINRFLDTLLSEKNYSHSNIFITDISVNDETAQKINEIHKGLYNVDIKLLDHHATAKWLNKYNWAYVNDYEISIYPGESEMKSSGTSIFYDYLWNNYELNNQLLVEFVEKVRRYDTWEWSTRFNDSHAKQLNDLLYIVGRDQFVERFGVNPSINFTNSEKTILDVEQYKISEYINGKQGELKGFDILEYRAGVVFAEQYHSELGNELAKSNPEFDFIVIINIASNKVSYRGVKENVDLGEDVAKVFGGGGHPRAAGSQFDGEMVDDLIRKVFNIK
ncbi:DHH family phosphoesterase [Bacillus sp. SCS-151]|uniref:DHH family phosphoesterase n=1 Tax=Nanhaiella sioensis TaxID=3115293 RepID=UPI00397B0641